MDSISNLVELGKRLSESDKLETAVKTAAQANPWFIESFVQKAIDALISGMLNEGKLREWLSKYDVKGTGKTVGLLFAGNIPLVGFHDFLCCYVSGCRMQIKMSSKDDSLFPFILDSFFEIDNSLKGRVEIVERLKDFDAVIATGSNNSNRYFDYYFRGYPRILRKNRNSVAILNGNETNDDMERLADDIFLYFGFGCRNVSKLYVPAGFDIARLFPPLERKYRWLHDHNKYMSNYDYNRTVLLLNKTSHLANEFVMFLENDLIPSSIGTLNYEFWHDERVLKTQLKQNEERIQCVASKEPDRWESVSSVYFGETQSPGLADYADGIDTMKFLINLS